jgi:uncharacterized membrane protein
MPSTGGSTGLRTIWITLRAVNYTERVFIDTIKQVGTLSAAQNKLATQSLRAGAHAMSAGLMWATLGQSMDNTISKTITNIGVLQGLYGAMKPYVATLLTAVGVIQMLIGLEEIYIGLKQSKIVTIYAEAVAVYVLAHAWAIAAIGMMAAFGIFYALKPILGTIPALLIAVAVAVATLAIALWSMAMPLSIVTFGLAAAAGIAGIGAAMAFMGVREFPMGTRMVEATGPAVLHKGEVVYNPTTNRPSQIGNELSAGGPSHTTYEMPIHIETVNTKANLDDVDEKLRVGLHRVARNVRG